MPVVEHEVKPVYTAEAKRQKSQGAVWPAAWCLPTAPVRLKPDATVAPPKP